MVKTEMTDLGYCAKLQETAADGDVAQVQKLLPDLGKYWPNPDEPDDAPNVRLTTTDDYERCLRPIYTRVLENQNKIVETYGDPYQHAGERKPKTTTLMRELIQAGEAPSDSAGLTLTQSLREGAVRMEDGTRMTDLIVRHRSLEALGKDEISQEIRDTVAAVSNGKREDLPVWQLSVLDRAEEALKIPVAARPTWLIGEKPGPLPAPSQVHLNASLEWVSARSQDAAVAREKGVEYATFRADHPAAAELLDDVEGRYAGSPDRLCEVVARLRPLKPYAPPTISASSSAAAYLRQDIGRRLDRTFSENPTWGADIRRDATMLFERNQTTNKKVATEVLRERTTQHVRETLQETLADHRKGSPDRSATNTKLLKEAGRVLSGQQPTALVGLYRNHSIDYDEAAETIRTNTKAQVAPALRAVRELVSDRFWDGLGKDLAYNNPPAFARLMQEKLSKGDDDSIVPQRDQRERSRFTLNGVGWARKWP